MDATLTAVAALTLTTVTRRTRRSRVAVAADRALVARIVDSLNRNPRAVEKALVLLFDRQTTDEQRERTTRYDNKVGFRKDHANAGAWLVNVVMASNGGRLPAWALPQGRRIALRYARTQLLRAAKEKQATVLVAPAPLRIRTPEQVMGEAAVARNRMLAEADDLEDAIAESEAQAELAYIEAACRAADEEEANYYDSDNRPIRVWGHA